MNKASSKFINQQRLYISPFTDFGFKRLFGEDNSQESLISFLNDLLPIDKPIVDISYKNPEKMGNAEDDRKSVYDIYCTDQEGRHFIVELQNIEQAYFRDRTVFYSTFPIQKQAQKGSWNYQLQAVYCVALLGFAIVDAPSAKNKTKNETIIQDNDYLHIIKLKDQKNRVFYDKLTFVFIEFPKFNKTEKQLDSHLDKWLYFFKNLDHFQTIPKVLEEPIFQQALDKAALANLSSDEQERYIKNAYAISDYENCINTSFAKGEQKGLEEGKAAGLKEGKREREKEIVLNMLKNNFTIKEIALCTGISEAIIKKIKAIA